MNISKHLYLIAFALLVGIHANALPQKTTQLLQGYKQSITGNTIQYACHTPEASQALIVRNTEKSTPIEWKGEQLSTTKTNGYTTYTFIVGMSNILPGVTSPNYHLSLNGENILKFHLSKDSEWSFKAEKNRATLTYEERMKDARNDRFGYLYLTIPTKDIDQTKEPIFKLTADSGAASYWLMIFQSEITNKLTAMPTSGVLKSNGKQVIKLTYSHYAKPRKVVIKLGDEQFTKQAVFGINNYEIAIKPTTKREKRTISLSNGNKSITAQAKIVPPKKWQVNFVQHTHTDIGYTRPQHEILSEHIRFIDYALDYCDQTDDYPNDAKFRWTCEAAWAVSEYIRTRPESQIKRLKQRIKEGRIEVTGMYFNYDELPSEQELAYSLYPLKQFKEEGIKVETAMQNDVNGIAWSFSELFPEMGIKYLIMGTHGHKALIPFDMPTAFWWESPSGKKTLAYRAEHYNHGNFLQVEKSDFQVFEQKTLAYLNSLEEHKYPHDIASVQYSGYFTDNAPPSTSGSDMIKKWNDKYTSPKLRMAVASEFMKEIEDRYGEQLDTYKAAWPDWWTDGFGSAAREAAIYRYAQTTITANQILLSLSKILGAKTPLNTAHEIDETNKALLFYGEHTFGFHASVREPFNKETMEQRAHKGAYAWESYRRSRSIGETALGLLQQDLPRYKDKAGITVLNPLNWERTGISIIYADHEVMPIDKNIELRDENNKSVKKQLLRSYADASYWMLWAENVPALGIKNYTVNITDATPQTKESVDKEFEHIENEWYNMELDLKRGVITKWYDKELKIDLLDKESKWKMGELIYERDTKRGALDLFKAGEFTRYAPKNIRFKSFTEGEIWDAYHFVGTSDAGVGKDNFWMELRVFKNCKQVNLAYRINKKMETEPEALYVSFPFKLKNGKTLFDVPGGHIEAGVDQIPGSSSDWNTVQNFASINNGSAQIILGSREIPLMQFGNINLGRFKKDAVPESNHIFTWPMNNYWVTNFNADQHGEFEWSYYLTSSNSGEVAEATRFSFNNRFPIVGRVIPKGRDRKTTISGSILKIEPDNLLLVNAYPIEKEAELVIQVREIEGKEATIEISSPFQSNLNIEACSPTGEQLEHPSNKIKPWETKFFKITL